jgi:hypothetical protein
VEGVDWGSNHILCVDPETLPQEICHLMEGLAGALAATFTPNTRIMGSMGFWQ